MSKEKSLAESFSELNDVAKSYIDARIGLFKASLLEHVARSGTYFFTVVLTLVVLASIALLLTLAFSFWYGNTIGSVHVGLLISAGLYAIAGGIIILLRKQIFSNSIIKHIGKVLFEEKEEQEK